MAADKASMPKLDIHSLPGPETITRRVLPNGMTLLARENFASPSVVLAGNLLVGGISDPSDRAGLADLTASALMRGTASRSFDDIYQTIESIGASLSIGAGTHHTSYRGKALAEDLSVVLELLNDVLRHPSFPKKDVEQLRAEKLTGLALRDQDTSSVADMTFDGLLYKDHPYAQPSDGYPATVGRLKAGDLRTFHRRAYGPSGAVLAVVGAVKAEAALDAAEALFGDWSVDSQASSDDAPDARPLRRQARKNVTLEGKTQVDIVMGAAGPRRRDDDYLAASLSNSILGRFGLYGRIGDRVRQQEGLAYYAYSSVTGGTGPGPWKVSAGVNPANADRAIELIKDEVRRLTEKKVTASELTDNQANFLGRLPLQLESNGGVASGLVYIERHNLGLDYYQKYPERILQVTRDAVLDAARHYLDPDRLAIAVAGPKLPGT
jgi:zinc protease